jgi:cytidylate kinase
LADAGSGMGFYELRHNFQSGIEKEDSMAVITISRQFGAGGRTLGKMVAKELGYIFADDQIIERIAEAANVSEDWVHSVEKEAGTHFTRMISSLVNRNLVDKILGGERGYIDEQIYLDYLVVIIAQMAEEGDVVILGRGSQYILNDHPDAHHILLIDEFENRVNFLMKHYDLTHKQAVQKVSSEDKRRMNLYRKLGKTDYDHPSLYHLTLNMSKMDMKTAQNLILKLVKS